MSVALVTGAGGGIGAAIAAALARRGDLVVVNDVDSSAAAAVAARIGGGAVAAVADVSDPDAVAAMVAETVERHGGLDTLVNCAALSGPEVIAHPLDVTPEQWRRIVAVDLDGVFFCSQAAARAMSEGGGTIVNIASVSGMVAEPHAAAYCASKAGVIGLTKSLALDLGPLGIRVCAVAPGDIETPTADAAQGSRSEPDGRPAPVGRRGTPEDVAALVCFASGPDATFISGTTLVVDGGRLAY